MGCEDKGAKAIYDKEKYEWLKEHHLCVSCKKQDAYTLGGHIYCYECNSKRLVRSEEYRQSHREQRRAMDKERYEYFKQKGICAGCRKRVAKEGHVYCDVCLGKFKKRHASTYIKSYTREEAVSNGMCRTCLKEKVKPGYKICEKCYQKCCDNLSEARKKAGHSYWRDANHLLFIPNY